MREPSPEHPFLLIPGLVCDGHVWEATDAALTGAECTLKGAAHTYVLCRPPGHHAESRVFGGFCYFNNAAIAAHYLSGHGRVAFIDIDHQMMVSRVRNL